MDARLRRVNKEIAGQFLVVCSVSHGAIGQADFSGLLLVR
jgi:hypothetical protein